MTGLSQSTRFWMICRKPTGPQSKTEPRARYETRADAVEAAQKVADQTGKRMLILEPVGEIAPRDKKQGNLL